jgi:hypothetical protein
LSFGVGSGFHLDFHARVSFPGNLKNIIYPKKPGIERSIL